MLNRDLRLALAYPHQFTRVTVINPCLDGSEQQYGIDTAIDDGSLDGEPYVVIETKDDIKHSATAEQIRRGLDSCKPDNEVLIYVPGWEGQQFAYFAIDNVSFNVLNHQARIILGDWRYGG